MKEKTPCTKCSAPTARLDGVCPNCMASARAAEPRNSEFERLHIQRRGNLCEDCGHEEPLALLLIKNLGRGILPPKRLMGKLAWVKEAAEKPSEFIVRCLNCQSRFNPSPGRKPKYANTFERKRAKLESARKMAALMRLRVQAAVGSTCIECSGPADGVHWIGPDGEGPVDGRWEESRKRIVEDPEYRMNFRSFCDAHRPLPYFARAKRGEVPKPRHWRSA